LSYKANFGLKIGVLRVKIPPNMKVIPVLSITWLGPTPLSGLFPNRQDDSRMGGHDLLICHFRAKQSTADPSVF